MTTIQRGWWTVKTAAGVVLGQVAARDTEQAIERAARKFGVGVKLENNLPPVMVEDWSNGMSMENADSPTDES
jgi:hypothetical protein